MEKDIKEVNFNQSLLLFLSIVSIIILGLLVLKIDLHVVLLLSLFLTIGYTLKLGYSFDNIKNAMSLSIKKVYDAMLIFILIGATIGVWMYSGTIPSLIYYGLNILSPSIFLPAGLIICSLTSLATGTSWGTVSTVGIALAGIGESLCIPLPITAGMIVSGAFFGDKISPMSDTTNLAAASTGTDLYKHISSMLYTTVPTYVLALIMYTAIGFNYSSNNIDYSQIMLIQNTLKSTFSISVFCLVPVVVVIALSILKRPAIISMSFGVIFGIIFAIILQHGSLYSVLESLNLGYTIPTNIKIVDTLILRGGIQNMMETFSLAFIALSLGGILDEIGYLRVLVEKILYKIKSTGSLILLTISSCILSNAVMGEAYLSIILNANLYKTSYKKFNLQSCMLSRTIEEGATLTAGLIPWTTAGVFISATLGINSFEYAPFAFFNLLNPILSIAFAYLELFILKNKNE